MVRHVTDFVLYRWRYWIGYGLVGLAGLALLAIAFFYAPGGLSRDEMQSAVLTNALSFQTIDANTIINGPYHVLQWLSLKVFGLTELGIKLPSMIIAAVTIVGMFGLLKYWFRRNVAILTTIIVVTTGHFLFVAQNGTPAIMPMFWAVWILFSALMVSRNAQFTTLWKVIMFGCAALSLYTPLSVYMLLAIISSALLHPHLRYIIREMSTVKVIVALVLAFGLLTPLGYAISIDRSIAMELVGIPEKMPNLLDNLSLLGKYYIDFVHPSSGVVMTPIYGLGSILLILLGIVRLFTTKYTARGYILTAWLVLLIPVTLFNPAVINTTFVPLVLLIAMGVQLLFSRWYQMFPHNPYARLAGLVPLAILLGSMTISGVARYFDGYTHDPATSSYFTQDLSLLNRQISEQSESSLLVVVHPENKSFYQLASAYNSRIEVSDQLPPTLEKHTLVAGSLEQTYPAEKLSKILTSHSKDQADRFYLYKK